MKKFEKWFDEFCVNNVDELIEIGEVCNQLVDSYLSMKMTNPKLPIAIYAKIFEAISEFVKSKQADCDEYCFEAVSRVKLGFRNYCDENEEKTGNYVFSMEHIPNAVKDEPADPDETRTITLCVEWNGSNIKAQTDEHKSVSVAARKKISSDLDLDLGTHEVIMPLFGIIHNQIIKYSQLKRVDTQVNEYLLDVAGLYKVSVEVDSSGEEFITFIPSIFEKRNIKGDLDAGKGDN